MFFFDSGCKIQHIREVDWYKKQTREHDYGVITYWQVEANGMRTHADRTEELDPRNAGPDYTYECMLCGSQFWFWSDVIHHVQDAAKLGDTMRCGLRFGENKPLAQLVAEHPELLHMNIEQLLRRACRVGNELARPRWYAQVAEGAASRRHQADPTRLAIESGKQETAEHWLRQHLNDNVPED